jgi:uncharacterized membrane protein YphA (DoxX/SURF4 family)
MNNQIKIPEGLFTTLRILVGWHFLYEGITKLVNASWSAGPFLLESTWWFSGIFKTMATHHALLSLVDLLNIWGLLFIGLGLFFGLFTRIAAWSGAALLLLYYIARPPFVGLMDGIPSEGSYIWVNKNLIEMFLLILLARIPVQWMLGFDQLIFLRKEGHTGETISNKGAITVPKTDNPVFSDLPKMDRRRVLKNLITLPVMGGFSYAVLKNFGYESYEEKDLKVNAVSSASTKSRNFASLSDLKEKVPSGRIGNLEVSRLICGGNLVAGFAHSRDLIYVSELLKKYFTQEKIWETLRLCEACGINTAILRTAEDTIHSLSRYWRQGGKIQWIAQTYPKPEDVITNPQMAIDNGAKAIFIQGNIADGWIAQGRIDLFEKWFNYFHNKGIPLGVGGHEIEVARTMEEKGYPVDFYMKTLHDSNYWSWQADEPKINVIKNNIDNYWSRNPEETAKFMETVKKKWIAYKILAAGAINPEVGMKYAFEKGADFACVGMFDYQVVEDCNILTKTLKQLEGRTRFFV